MKKLIIVLIAIFCVLSVNAQSDFSRGYNIGYGEGYCYDKGIGCIKPISPIPPIPKIEESLDNYQDGHKRGFTDGLAKQKSESQNKQSNHDRKRYETTEPKFLDDFIYQPNYDLILKILALKQQQIENEKYINVNSEISKKETKVNSEGYKPKEVKYKEYPSYSKNFTGIQKVYSFSPINDKPSMGEGEKIIGQTINNSVIILEKYNNKFYKVKSGDIIGYLWAGWFVSFLNNKHLIIST